MSPAYDALLVVSFGGPEKPDDVVPFLENVVRGKDVPRRRLLEVAEHYELFGGESPINAQIRALLASLVDELNAHGPRLPVYWGNRNWHPMLADTLRQMAGDGVRHALAFVTSAFGSYPGCRQYLEDIDRARREVGDAAPEVDKLRLFYNHPGFIETMADRVAAAAAQISEARRGSARVVFTAHGLPMAMARRCHYEAQLREACRLVAESVGGLDWRLAYQSRSGRPTDPWLEPEVGDAIVKLHELGDVSDVVIVPIGFLVETMETVFDLDVEIGGLCDHLGINVVRAAAAGAHPRLVRMIRELVEERLDARVPRMALGEDGPWPNVCPEDCCRPE